MTVDRRDVLRQMAALGAVALTDRRGGAEAQNQGEAGDKFFPGFKPFKIQTGAPRRGVTGARTALRSP